MRTPEATYHARAGVRGGLGVGRYFIFQAPSRFRVQFSPPPGVAAGPFWVCPVVGVLVYPCATRGGGWCAASVSFAPSKVLVGEFVVS